MRTRVLQSTFVTTALTLLVVGASAAQTITPPGTAISGTATNPTISYGAATIKCNTGTFSGTTKSPADTDVDFGVTFSGNCNISGLAATAICPTALGGLRFTATVIPTSGTINLNFFFDCRFNVGGVCEVRIVGPQTTGNSGTLNEAATTLTATLTVTATRTGSSLCGPAAGPAVWSASYNVTPNTLAIT